MNKQEMIQHLKNRIQYCQDEQGKYEAKHGEFNAEFGDNHSVWSELADWQKGRACAFNVVIELLEELEA